MLGVKVLPENPAPQHLQTTRLTLVTLKYDKLKTRCQSIGRMMVTLFKLLNSVIELLCVRAAFLL